MYVRWLQFPMFDHHMAPAFFSTARRSIHLDEIEGVVG